MKLHKASNAHAFNLQNTTTLFSVVGLALLSILKQLSHKSNKSTSFLSTKVGPSIINDDIIDHPASVLATIIAAYLHVGSILINVFAVFSANLVIVLGTPN